MEAVGSVLERRATRDVRRGVWEEEDQIQSARRIRVKVDIGERLCEGERREEVGR